MHCAQPTGDTYPHLLVIGDGSEGERDESGYQPGPEPRGDVTERVPPNNTS